jgi:hypothetical protein
MPLIDRKRLTRNGCKYMQFVGVGHPDSLEVSLLEPGDVYIDVADKVVYYWTGSTWNPWRSMETSADTLHPTANPSLILVPSAIQFSWEASPMYNTILGTVKNRLGVDREDNAKTHVEIFCKQHNFSPDSPHIHLPSGQAASTGSVGPPHKRKSSAVDHERREGAPSGNPSQDVNMRSRKCPFVACPFFASNKHLIVTKLRPATGRANHLHILHRWTYTGRLLTSRRFARTLISRA